MALSRHPVAAYERVIVVVIDSIDNRVGKLDTVYVISIKTKAGCRQRYVTRKATWLRTYRYRETAAPRSACAGDGFTSENVINTESPATGTLHVAIAPYHGTVGTVVDKLSLSASGYTVPNLPAETIVTIKKTIVA